MSTLITGGAGFLGARLAQTLAQRGVKVVALDRVEVDIRPGDSGPGEVHSIQADVTDAAQLIAVMQEYQVDRVVHGAAVVGVAASAGGPASAVNVNINGSLAVFDAVRKVKDVRRVIDMSSEEVYGNFTDEPIAEDSAKQPISPYGISKYCVELLGGYYADTFDVPYVAARLSWVYGPNFPRNRVPNSWLADALSGESSSVSGGAGWKTDYTFIDDAIAGLVALHDADALDYRAYNVASGVGSSLAETARLVEQLVPSWSLDIGDGVFELAPGVAAARKGAMGIDRIRRELGYSPKVNLSEGLELTLKSLSEDDANVAGRS